MKVATTIRYHALALLALLVHLSTAIYVLLAMALTVPSGMEVVGLVWKLVVVATWFVVLGAAIPQWLRRRWVVVLFPLITIVCFGILNMIGTDLIGTFLNWGY